MKTATEVLRSLVADIEAMKYEAAEMGWFGGFDVGEFDLAKFYIQWPNLAILLEEAKQVLKEQNKETVLLKTKLTELASAHFLLDKTKDELARRIVFHSFESKDYYCQFCKGRGTARESVVHLPTCLLSPFPSALAQEQNEN